MLSPLIWEITQQGTIRDGYSRAAVRWSSESQRDRDELLQPDLARSRHSGVDDRRLQDPDRVRRRHAHEEAATPAVDVDRANSRIDRSTNTGSFFSVPNGDVPPTI